MDNILNNIYAVKALQSFSLGIMVLVLAWIASSVAAKSRKPTSEAPLVIKYTAILFFGISLVFIWLEGIGPILTALTIVAAALTIVSKELILNFLGSFVIFWRELFAIGDRVQIGDNTGDVIDKGLFYFTLLEAGKCSPTGHSTGRLIKVPNALTLTMPVINATRGAGYVWNEVIFTVTRSSDWEKARALLVEMADNYTRHQSINLDKVRKSFERRKVFFNTLTPKVYVAVGDGGIALTLRYICSSRLIRESEDYMTTGFLAGLEPDVIQLYEC